MRRGAILGAIAVFAFSFGRQSWVKHDLEKFLTGKSGRVWNLQAKKGRAYFADIRLGAKFKFFPDGKLVISQSGSPDKSWHWDFGADSKAPVGFRLNLNGSPFLFTPIRIGGDKTDKLSLTSMDEKLDIPAKVYMTSVKAP